MARSRAAQELHRAGIEVYIDVVYNHTAEARGGRRVAGHACCSRVTAWRAQLLTADATVAHITHRQGDDKDPYVLSMRGIDNKEYYIVDTNRYEQMLNFRRAARRALGHVSRQRTHALTLHVRPASSPPPDAAAAATR